MTDIDQAVDFLIANNSLELGVSPWPTYEEGEEIHPIDWERLFPNRRREDYILWELPVTEDELGALENLLGKGPPREIVDKISTCDPEWDVCAWYQPIHFFGHDWGIFI